MLTLKLYISYIGYWLGLGLCVVGVYGETESDLNPERQVLMVVWGGLVVDWAIFWVVSKDPNLNFNTPQQ